MSSATGAISLSTSLATERRDSSCSGVSLAMARPPRGRLVHRQRRGIDHDAVLAARMLDRHVPFPHVLQDARGVAPERRPITARARLLEGDDVAGSEIRGLLAVHEAFSRPGVDDGAREPAALAAEEAVGREALALREIRRLSVLGPERQPAPAPD